MAPNSGVSNKKKDQVVRLYEQGVTTAEIQRRTEVPRSTIYWILEQRGIQPDRQRKRAAVPSDLHDEGTLAWALEKVLEQEREIGRLEQALRREQETNAALLARLIGSDGRRR